jgi:hypothetical protein
MPSATTNPRSKRCAGPKRIARLHDACLQQALHNLAFGGGALGGENVHDKQPALHNPGLVGLTAFPRRRCAAAYRGGLSPGGASGMTRVGGPSENSGAECVQGYSCSTERPPLPVAVAGIPNDRLRDRDAADAWILPQGGNSSYRAFCSGRVTGLEHGKGKL